MSYTVIGSAAEARALVRQLERMPGPFGFDTETEGINPKKQPAAGDHGAIVCFTVAWPEGTDVAAAFFWADLDIVAVMGPWWATAPVVGHNLYGFDAHLCRRAGYGLGNIRMDTLRAHRLIDTHPDASHGLKALMPRYIGTEPVGEFESLFSRRKCLGIDDSGEPRMTWRKVADEARVPTLVGGVSYRLGEAREPVKLSTIRTEHTSLLPELYAYACLDAVAALKLWQLFESRMADTHWVQP